MLPRAFLSVLFRYIIYVNRDIEEEDIEEELRSRGSREMREAYMKMTIAESLREKGKLEGKIEGELLDKQHVLLRLLEKKFGSIDETEKEKVINVRNRDRLDRAIDRLLDANSIEEVLQPLN